MDVFDVKRLMRKETVYLTDGWDGEDREYLEARCHDYLASWQQQQSVDVDPEVGALAIKQLCDDFSGYGPIRDLLEDQHITEIMINGPHSIFVERNGRTVETDVTFDDDAHLMYAINHMIKRSGRRVDQSSPCADFSLENGSRVNVTIPPLSVDGISVTIRKLIQSIDSLEALVGLGTLDERMANFLIHCLNGGVNMLFAGATGTGKTTTINILSQYIPEGERIITIEDTLELNLRPGNFVRLLSRPPDIKGEGEISIRFLFTNALRMRPKRLILGEVRGAEAMDYIQALNSGHSGTLAVLHAASPRDAITRLETMALYAGLDLPMWSIRGQVASGLDLIVQHEQLADGTRKITHITEVIGQGKEEILLQDVYRFDAEDSEAKAAIKGSFVAVEAPTFLAKLRTRGIHMEDELFQN